MRFDLSEEQALLRASTRDFFSSELALEKTRAFMEHDPRGYDAASWERLAEMGYLGLVLPASLGGQGLGAVELAVVAEEAGRACVPGPLLETTVAGALLAAAGGQDTLVREIASGRKLVTIARDDALFRGERRAETRFERGRVRGRKFFVPFGAFADALAVTTTGGVALAYGPFEALPTATIDPAQRFAEIAFDQPAILLGPSSLLAPVDRLAAVGAAATLLGLMSRALETTLEYVRTRRTFGRPIGSFQALQHRIADMLLKTESTRAAVYRAAWCLATADADAPLACAAAKAFAGDAARLVCGEAIQMHGGIGFTWEVDLHFYLKRVKTLEQHHGSTEDALEQAFAAAGL